MPQEGRRGKCFSGGGRAAPTRQSRHHRPQHRQSRQHRQQPRQQPVGSPGSAAAPAAVPAVPAAPAAARRQSRQHRQHRQSRRRSRRQRSGAGATSPRRWCGRSRRSRPTAHNATVPPQPSTLNPKKNRPRDHSRGLCSVSLKLSPVSSCQCQLSTYALRMRRRSARAAAPKPSSAKLVGSGTASMLRVISLPLVPKVLRIEFGAGSSLKPAPNHVPDTP
jgi:hypothetical protein